MSVLPHTRSSTRTSASPSSSSVLPFHIPPPPLAFLSLSLLSLPPLLSLRSPSCFPIFNTLPLVLSTASRRITAGRKGRKRGGGRGGQASGRGKEVALSKEVMVVVAMAKRRTGPHLHPHCHSPQYCGSSPPPPPFPHALFAAAHLPQCSDHPLRRWKGGGGGDEQCISDAQTKFLDDECAR